MSLKMDRGISLNEGTSFLEDKSLGHPQSPISPLDFDVAKQGWDAPCSSGGSQICPTLPRNVPICPIFVMSSNLRTARQAGEYSGTQGMKAFEPCQSPSPRDRILQLAGDGEIDSVEERPNWFASLTGEWIVVRSPKSKFSPNLDAPFSTFTNRSSSDGIPCVQPEDRDCGSIPKHTGDSTLVLHHSSSVFGHDDRGFSSALTVEKAMLPCIQPQDKDCSSIPKHAGDSTLVLHHGSSDVGQPDRGFSSALTVEQAKQLTKHSHIDTDSYSMPIPLLHSCVSHRQLSIYIQIAKDRCPSCFTNSIFCFLRLKTKGFLFYSRRACASACNFSGLNMLVSQTLRRIPFITMNGYSLQIILTLASNVSSKFIVIHSIGLSISPRSELNAKYCFYVFTMLLNVYIGDGKGFEFDSSLRTSLNRDSVNSIIGFFYVFPIHQ